MRNTAAEELVGYADRLLIGTGLTATLAVEYLGTAGRDTTASTTSTPTATDAVLHALRAGWTTPALRVGDQPSAAQIAHGGPDQNGARA